MERPMCRSRVEPGPDWREIVPRSACFDEHTYLMLNGLHRSDFCDCFEPGGEEFDLGAQVILRFPES